MSKIYQVKGQTGAYILLSMSSDINTMQAGAAQKITAKCQLVGAPHPVTVPIENLAPYTSAAKWQPSPTNAQVVDLAQEAITSYGLPPSAVLQAATHMHKREVMRAVYNALGAPIIPDENTIIVKVKRGWMLTTRGKCDCGSHGSKRVCAHRIAAWMYREARSRSLAYARKSAQNLRRKKEAAKQAA